jgi:hypothetical protein
MQKSKADEAAEPVEPVESAEDFNSMDVPAEDAQSPQLANPDFPGDHASAEGPMHRHAMSVSENIIIVVLAAVFWFLKSPNLISTRVYVTRKKTAKNSVVEDMALATILSDAATWERHAVQIKKKGVQFFSHVFVRFEIQKPTTSHWHKHFVPASGIMAHAVQFVF